MVSQGAIALGGIVWGFSSQAAGVKITLVVAAVSMALSLLLAIPLSINFTKALSFDPPPISCVMMPLVSNPQPREGPVAITFEIEVDRMRGREFLLLMREVRLIHRRNGAFSWRLNEDLTRSNIYRIEMMIPSWTGYLRQRERLTKAEQETINKVWRLQSAKTFLKNAIISASTENWRCVVRTERHLRQHSISPPTFGDLIRPLCARVEEVPRLLRRGPATRIRSERNSAAVVTSRADAGHFEDFP